jgi:hypothetical protein
MSSLQRITLHLARTPEFPGGSAAHGYAFVAPLDEAGKIATDRWKVEREACTVERFWGRAPPQIGRLVHRAGGFDGATWGFDYDGTRLDDDEAGYRFGHHAFRLGEYVSIREADGETRPFRIVDVQPA